MNIKNPQSQPQYFHQSQFQPISQPYESFPNCHPQNNMPFQQFSNQPNFMMGQCMPGEFYSNFQGECQPQQVPIYQQANYQSYGNHSPNQFHFLQQQNQAQNQPMMFQQQIPRQGNHKNSFNEMRSLQVVVIPMETNQIPYQMELRIKGNETSLKQVFDDNHNNYWTKVFKGHSPREPPSYSVFRKAMNIEATYYSEFQGKSLHILLLKCEGYKFPRNPNAHFLELFCNTHFYGPLVVAMNMNQVPYHLDNFKGECMNEILKINEAEKRQYPPPFTPTNSQKKNKTMPFYVAEKQSDSSEDLQNLKDTMDPELFYIYRYKTAYCPQKNVKHDWSSCIYAHRPQDFRRAPDKFAYFPDDCNNFQMDQEDGCPLGFKCKFAHSTYERLYHPLKYKTNPCDQSFKTKRKHCKRGEMCAFYHEKNQKRQPEICQKSQLFYNIARTQLPNQELFGGVGNMQMQPVPFIPQQQPAFTHQMSLPAHSFHSLQDQSMMISPHSPPGFQPKMFMDMNLRTQRTMSSSVYELSSTQRNQNQFSPPQLHPLNFTPESFSHLKPNSNLNFSPNHFTLNPESKQSSSDSDQLHHIDRKLSSENAFASPGGLPYFSEFKIDEDQDNDDLELHIDEDLKQQILSNIYCVNSTQQSNLFSSNSAQLNHATKGQDDKGFALPIVNSLQNPNQSDDLLVKD